MVIKIEVEQDIIDYCKINKLNVKEYVKSLIKVGHTSNKYPKPMVSKKIEVVEEKPQVVKTDLYGE